MTRRSVLQALRQWTRLDPPWWREVCAYYGVTRRRAVTLGRRQRGRRPAFPGGPSGLTYEEIWARAPRETAEQIAAFYRDLGPWPVFRQALRRRYGAWPDVARDLPRGGTLLEYGCGIAPVTAWLERRRRDFPAVLVDVPGHALDFAVWRLRSRRDDLVEPAVAFLTLNPLCLDLATVGLYDVAVVSEVLEHVVSPLSVMQSVVSGLCPGGVLYEDFTAHAGDGSPADLPSAQAERTDMYLWLFRHATLTRGAHPLGAEPGGVRRWVAP